jgi:hypothetical protein
MYMYIVGGVFFVLTLFVMTRKNDLMYDKEEPASLWLVYDQVLPDKPGIQNNPLLIYNELFLTI